MAPSSRRIWIAIIACVALIILLFRRTSSSSRSPPTDPKPFRRRIVSIGDLHGDYPHFMTILRMANLVDQKGKWIGKQTILVQTGDIVDRGKDTIAIYKTMETLREQAAKAGGQVVSVTGNHEFMNALYDWRYVTREDIATFGSEAERRKAFSADGWIGKAWLDNYNVTARVPYISDAFKPSLLPHVSALSNDSIATNTTFEIASAPLDDFTNEAAVYLHGGIYKTWADVDRINRVGKSLLRKALEAPLSSRGIPRDANQEEHEVYNEHGPLWYRGLALDPENEICPMVDEILEKIKARRIVIGHTPNLTGIRSRCAGRVIIIDTGNSRAYGGVLSALEISYSLSPPKNIDHSKKVTTRRWSENEIITAIYVDKTEILVRKQRSLDLPV